MGEEEGREDKELVSRERRAKGERILGMYMVKFIIRFLYIILRIRNILLTVTK